MKAKISGLARSRSTSGQRVRKRLPDGLEERVAKIHRNLARPPEVRATQEKAKALAADVNELRDRLDASSGTKGTLDPINSRLEQATNLIRKSLRQLR